MHLTIGELLDYTDEERAKWQQWFSIHGNDPLRIKLAGETHPNVGALILHCFWAEIWYAYWMRGELLSQDSDIAIRNRDLSCDNAEALFNFGLLARKAMRAFADAADQDEWERLHEVKGGGFQIRGSARKLVAHILVHEIRHWAQVAIAVRQQNLPPPGDHDLVFSQAFGPLATRL
jgi:uncharacterized damage-inducible protein DinB